MAAVAILCSSAVISFAQGTVQPGPLGQLAGYNQSGTQAIVGPGSTTLNYVTPMLQGIGNTDQFSTTTGIANFFSTYATGYAVVPPTSISTEAWSIPPSGAAFADYRGRTSGRVGHNTVLDGQICTFFAGSQTYSSCIRDYFDLNRVQHDSIASRYEPSGKGWNLGDTHLPGGLWTVRHHLLIEQGLYTRGIKQGMAMVTHGYGIGDVGGFYHYLDCRGGATDASAEGCVGHYVSMLENTSPFKGTSYYWRGRSRCSNYCCHQR